MKYLPLTICALLLVASPSWAEENKATPEAATPEAAPLNKLTAKEAKAGFVLLFDGKTLKGWEGATKGYQAENGLLVCKKKGGGNLYTEREYGDFKLRFDFRLEAGSNNGVGIRTPRAADAAYQGMEIQILDNSSPKYADLKPHQYHGSVYGVVAAKRGHQNPVGEWNSQEILCKGSRVRVILNGQTIVDADIHKASTPQTLDGKPHPGLKREKGYIGFLGHGTRVELRNIRIKVLDAPKTKKAE